MNWPETFLSYNNATHDHFFLCNKTFGEFDICSIQKEAGVKKPLGKARTSKFASHLNGPPNAGAAYGAPTVN